MPVVSVVMNVSNDEAFLAPSVDSILAQTLSVFEFIIIDDGSIDKSTEILSTYANRDPRVRVLRQENRGTADALNRAIELCGSPYIARMDANDIALPDRLKAQVDFLLQHTDIVLLGGAFELITTNNRVIRTVKPPLKDAEIREVMTRSISLCHASMIMRKDLVLACRGYRGQLGDAVDYDLWLRIADRGCMANLDRVLAQYRVTPRRVSIHNTRHQTLCSSAALVAAEHRKRRWPDPLWPLSEITPQFVDLLGVTSADIDQACLALCRYWVDVLRESDPELARQVAEDEPRIAAVS